ncbi:MAG: FliO/MopB family protein [Firmicutes bacterium]|nr:FliO/MopB family protein [Bacillota bacterium]
MADMDPIGTWDMLWYASKVLLALVVIVPALYYVLRHFGRRLAANRSMHGNMVVLDVLPLSGGKQLLLVKIGEQVILLSSSKESVAFICEMPRDTILQSGQFAEGHDLDSLRRWVDRWRVRGDGERDDHQE